MSDRLHIDGPQVYREVQLVMTRCAYLLFIIGGTYYRCTHHDGHDGPHSLEVLR